MVKEYLEGCSFKREKGECLEREDFFEFIIYRVKDFLFSIKDIEYWFFRVLELGKEVVRMFEGNNIWVGYVEVKGSFFFLRIFMIN